MAFYFIHYGFTKKLKKLRPTGKWKIEYDPIISFRQTFKPVLYIQHKNLFWNQWVSEDNVAEMGKIKHKINRCLK